MSLLSTLTGSGHEKRPEAVNPVFTGAAAEGARSLVDMVFYAGPIGVKETTRLYRLDETPPSPAPSQSPKATSELSGTAAVDSVRRTYQAAPVAKTAVKQFESPVDAARAAVDQAYGPNPLWQASTPDMPLDEAA